MDWNFAVAKKQPVKGMPCICTRFLEEEDGVYTQSWTTPTVVYVEKIKEILFNIKTADGTELYVFVL